ncbi:MAG: hypothetical protein P4L53_09750 [Candidatus Obscuribacterales bacterium]|nr:hypothetical protein [Candidatus Obscuribacterales bacterium]
MIAAIGYFFDNLGLFVVDAIVACGSAAGFAVILAVFLCTLVDIRTRGHDTNQDSTPAIGLGVFLGAIAGLAFSIWLLTFKSTGTVVSNLLGIALVAIIGLFIVTRIYKRIKNAQISNKPSNGKTRAF